MNTSGERLKALLLECDLTPSDFAALRKVSAQHINNWFRRGVPLARLEDVAEQFSVRQRWLSHGEGPKYIDLRTTAQHAAIPERPLPLGELPQAAVPVPFYRMNQGRLEHATELHPLIPPQALKRLGIAVQHSFCIEMPEDNLAPQLPQGTLLAVDRSFSKVVDGEYYALLHNGRLRVHQLSRSPGGILCLHSHDRFNHPTERYTTAQRREQQLEIVGWVFWWSCVRPSRPG